MGMAEHHRVDVRDVEREGVSIAGLIFSATLNHAAVEQQPPPVQRDNMAGAGDLPRGAEKLNLHGDIVGVAQAALPDPLTPRNTLLHNRVPAGL